jgi:hypothetical protein
MKIGNRIASANAFSNGVWERGEAQEIVGGFLGAELVRKQRQRRSVGMNAMAVEMRGRDKAPMVGKERQRKTRRRRK